MAEKTEKAINDKTEKLLYLDSDMPAGLREPFIKSGYRRAHSTVWQCVQSLFYINNESFNIWSHLLASCYFLVRYSLLLVEANSWFDRFYLPLLSSLIGTCTIYATSAAAHLLNSISEKGYKTCFFFDYAGISVYTFSSSQALFFYTRPVSLNWLIFRWPLLHLSVAAFFSFLTTYACCKTGALANKYSALFRALPVLAAWFNSVLPTLSGLVFCECHMTTESCMAVAACNALALSDLIRHSACIFLAGFMYSIRLPERLFPGRFDLIGNSHHFLHICCALGTEFAFKIVEHDMRFIRSANWVEATTADVTYGNTLGAVGVVMLVNAGIAFWFAKSLHYKDCTHNESKKVS